MERKRKSENSSNEGHKRIKIIGNDVVRRIQSQEGIRGKLVLIYSENEDAFTILQSAAGSQKVSFSITTDSKKSAPCIYELKINNEVIVKGEFPNNASARKELSRLALKNLKYTCISIIKKLNPEDMVKVEATPELFESSSKTNKGEFNVNSETVKNSIGARMMKMMGWTGGGLGSQEQGDKNLIMPSGQIDRRGLGQKLSPAIKEILKKYSKSEEIDSLAFSDKFTKEQRAFIHTLASQCNLKSKSYGKKENRVLILRKKLTPWQMVQHLLDVGGETAEYKLVLPLNEDTNENELGDS